MKTEVTGRVEAIKLELVSVLEKLMGAGYL
jgi:hypothetical protein